LGVVRNTGSPTMAVSRDTLRARLKTGICSYLRRINITDTQDCECGLPETVPHFLFSCSRWVEERETMREAHGEWWGNLPHAVGGRPVGVSWRIGDL